MQHWLQTSVSITISPTLAFAPRPALFFTDFSLDRFHGSESHAASSQNLGTSLYAAAAAPENCSLGKLVTQDIFVD